MQQPRKEIKNQGNSGFAMLVVAALFTAFAVIALVFLDNKTVTAQLTSQQQHQLQLTKLQSALTKFLLKEGRLPCPARYSISPNDTTNGMEAEYGAEMHPVQVDNSGNAITVSTVSDCSSAVYNTNGWSSGQGIDVLTSTNAEFVRGMVPFKVLGSYGIVEDDAYDAQGDRIMYIVNRQLTGGQGITPGASDFAAGNAKGYTTESATLINKVTNISTPVDFLLVSYGADKLGGLGHDQIPTATGAQADCSFTNTNYAQRLLSCNVKPTIPCSTAVSPPLVSENCNGDLTFVTMPHNISTQSTATDTSYSNTTYFDDEVIGTSVTCPNGKLTRNADGQCSNTYCWGSNNDGQLGNGTQSSSSDPVVLADSHVPTPVSLPKGLPSLQSISIGEDSAGTGTTAPHVTVCALSGDPLAAPYGDVYCWGRNIPFTTGTTLSKLPVKIAPTVAMTQNGTQIFQFTNVQVGYYSTCATGGILIGGNVINDGNIYCWGSNVYGQLGNGSTGSTFSVIPLAVTQPPGITFPNTSSKGLSGDGTHWCALGSDNQVYCWGKNDQAQLGNGTVDATNNPNPMNYKPANANAINTYDATQTNFIDGVPHIATSIGNKGTSVLLDNDQLIGWGQQWITGSPYAISITSSPTGLNNTFGLQTVIAGSTVLNGAENTRDITGFSTGANQHTCITTTGNPLNVYCRGNNAYGQLGDTTLTTRALFAPIVNSSAFSPPATSVMLNSISASDLVTCGIGSQGLPYCWGFNKYGQLGNNSTTNASVPTAVSLPGNVNSLMSIASAGSTTCALTKP